MIEIDPGIDETAAPLHVDRDVGRLAHNQRPVGTEAILIGSVRGRISRVRAVGVFVASRSQRWANRDMPGTVFRDRDGIAGGCITVIQRDVFDRADIDAGSK